MQKCLVLFLALASGFPCFADEPLPMREVMAFQVLLDRQNFSCGSIDGVMGTRTREALRAWQSRSGLPVTGQFDDATRLRLGTPNDVFTDHLITTDELNSLSQVPRTWLGRSLVERMGYETEVEYVAELYHAKPAAIRALNSNATWPNPMPGTLLTVPNPGPVSVEPAARVTISLGRKTLEVWDAHDNMIALFPCSIAANKAKRPVGLLQVVTIAPNPNYTFDPAVYPEDAEARELNRKLIIPPGPNNPVGVAWIGLNLPGYGMHGSPKPEDIGVTESHGCFRLANWNAEKLLKMVTVGTPVQITE